MAIYRISRSIVVDALQCKNARTVATDTGFINVNQGDWVVCGEGGETYIVDDAYFQCTFTAVSDTRFGTLESAEQRIHMQRAAIPVRSSRTCAHRAQTRSTRRSFRRRRVRPSR